jgi:hypothetical protein
MVTVPTVTSSGSAPQIGVGLLPAYRQTAELTGTVMSGYDHFGYAVAVSGSTVVVGAPDQAAAAARAYVFAKTASGWHRAAELVGSDTAPQDGFGQSVAVSGSTVVVGAYAASGGRAYVFTKTGTKWHQTTELAAPGATVINSTAFGQSVAISGKTVVVGAPAINGYTGRAYVFTKAKTSWHQTAALVASDPSAGSAFGEDVATSDNTVVVSATGSEGSPSFGAAYVFAPVGSGWRQTAELHGVGVSPAGDQFGYTVATSDNTIVVGAPTHDYGTGGAYVFTKAPTGWHQAAALAGPDTPECNFGASVAVAGNTIVVGAFNPLGCSNSRWAYVFTTGAGGWQQSALVTGSDTLTTGAFGASVSVSGNTIVIGDWGHDSGVGRAYVFER